MSLKTHFYRAFAMPTWVLLGLLALIGATGCGPRLKPEEFGTPVYEESKLPGAGDAQAPFERKGPAE